MQTSPFSKPVVVGSPTIIDIRGRSPVTITARPGAGGSMKIEISTSVTASNIDPSSPAASWRAWPGGTVTVETSDVLNAPAVAVRATALAADGVVEVVS